MPLSPTQIHEDEKEDLDVSMDVEERDPTPKPTAERTVDMDIDEGDSHSYSVAVEDHGGGTLDTSTVNGDDSYQRRSLSPRPTASEDPLNESLSDQGPPRNQVTLPLFAPVASSSSASSSPMTSQDHHVRLDSSAQEHEAKSKRLSDISEMRSSQELPPTQYEVEATQKVYDVEKSQLSIGSVDMDITSEFALFLSPSLEESLAEIVGICRFRHLACSFCTRRIHLYFSLASTLESSSRSRTSSSPPSSHSRCRSEPSPRLFPSQTVFPARRIDPTRRRILSCSQFAPDFIIESTSTYLRRFPCSPSSSFAPRKSCDATCTADSRSS